jgi:hypothetical protein
MKYSLRTSFARYVLALLASVFLVTVLGRMVTVTGAWAFSALAGLCVCRMPSGIFETCPSFACWGGFVLMVLGVAQGMARTTKS